MTIIALILVLAAIIMFYYYAKGDSKEYNSAKKFFKALCFGFVQYYCKGTPTRVVMYALQGIMVMYTGAAIGYSLATAIINYDAEHQFYSILVQCQWNDFSSRLTYVFLGAIVLIVVAFLFTSNYETKAMKKISANTEETNENVKEINRKLDIVLENQSRIIGKVSQNSHSSVTRTIINSYRKSIRELKIVTAYEQLEALENALNAESDNDPISHASIQYLMGVCTRYIKGKSDNGHFEKAYQLLKGQPITDYDLYERILEGMIYASCKNNNEPDAQKYADELRQISPDNFWTCLPELMTTEDLNATYQAIPGSLHKFKALTMAVMMGCKAHEYQLGVDLETYTYQGLTELTYDNFPIWVFDMSIAATRFVQQFVVRQKAKDLWNKEAEDLYNLTHTYLALLEKTEMSNLLSDTEFLENLTGYIKDQDAHRLELMAQKKENVRFKELYYLGYAMMLMDVEKYSEALQLLKGYGEGTLSSILNMRLTIAFRIENTDEMVEVIREVTERQLNIPDHLLPNYMQVYNNIFAEVEKYADKMVIPNPYSKLLFDQFIAFKRGKSVDVKKLQKEEANIPVMQYSFLAMIYRDKIGLDAAIGLMRKCIDPNILDLRIYLLISYYKQDKRYGVALYHLLKEQRQRGETNAILLRDELQMAEFIEDYEAVCDICVEMMNRLPDDAGLKVHYVKALRILGKIDEVKAYESQLLELTITDANLIKAIAGIYESIGEWAFLLEWLYKNITITKNQDVKDFYYIQSLNSRFGEEIFRQHERVEQDDVVVIDAGGNAKEVDATAGSVYEVLIGRHVGDRVTIRQSMDVKVTIQAIYSKYYRLHKEVRADISDNKSKNIRQFSIENIEKAENPLEEFHKIIGITKESEQAYQEEVASYQKGETSLCTFVSHSNEVASMINLLFDPSFRVYNMPPNVFKQQTESESEQLPVVLDLSSLIMLCEISKRFGLQVSEKFIVPISLKMILNETLTNEECGSAAHVHQGAIENLTIPAIDENQSSLWNITRGVLDWMDAHCEVKIVEEKLCAIYPENSTHFTISELDSVVLASQHRLMLSEDWGLMASISNMCPIVSVSNWLYIMGYADIESVFKYMIECGNVGVSLSAQYIAEQYAASVQEEKNTYEMCLANVAANPADWQEILGAGEIILNNTEDKGREEAVTNMFAALLSGLPRQSVFLLLCNISKIGSSDELVTCFYNAYQRYVAGMEE